MNDPNYSHNNFQVLLERYRNALNFLYLSKKITEEQALQILFIRDQLGEKLKDELDKSDNQWIQIIKADQKLKLKTYKIIKVIDLSAYRESLPVNSDAWWWNMDQLECLHPYNQFDWLLKIIKFLFLGINFTLIGVLSTRFLYTSSGILEIGGLIFSTFISLLQTKNIFSELRTKWFVKLMHICKIPEYFYEKIQLLITIIIFIVLLITFQYFSSDYYEKKGDENKNLNLIEAERNYLKAIELDSNNFNAHLKLGDLYDDLQNFDNAKKYYLIAAKGKLFDAYNNLIYLYLQDNKSKEAINLLQKVIKLLNEKDENLDELTEEEQRKLQDQRYFYYKNLGWAKFQENHYKDAILNLQIASRIANDLENKEDSFANPGSADCLLAQAFEKQSTQEQRTDLRKKYLNKSEESWKICYNKTRYLLLSNQNIKAEQLDWFYKANIKVKVRREDNHENQLNN